MTTTATRAALELLAETHAIEPLEKGPLPADILTLIQAAAGDEIAISKLTKSTGLIEQDCREMAANYLRKTLFASDASEHRLLGLKRDPKTADIVRHRRWMLKWLHPDVNSNPEDQINFKRVSEAAKRLSEPAPKSTAPTPPIGKPERRKPPLEKVGRRKNAQMRRRKMLPLWPRIKRRLKQLMLIVFTLGALLALAYSIRAIILPSVAIN